MLRLLAQRGEQGYEDIAALKGVGVAEVRAQARDAVRQLEDEGLPPPAIPLEPSASAEPPPEEPAKAEPAGTEPAAAAPPPEPQVPAEPPTPPEPVAQAKGAPPGGGRPQLRLPRDPGARAAIAAGLIAIVAVVVVLIVGGAGGGSSSTSTAGTGGAEAASEPEGSPASSKGLTAATLSPVAGGEGQGKAVFGRVKSKLALQVTATGLRPTSQGESYTVWIAESPQKMLPLASTRTDKSGRIAAQFEVPTEVLAYLANETFSNIVISRTSNALLEAALKKATSEKKAPIYTGTHVLEGAITGPIIGAAIRQEEKEKEGG